MNPTKRMKEPPCHVSVLYQGEVLEEDIELRVGGPEAEPQLLLK